MKQIFDRWGKQIQNFATETASFLAATASQVKGKPDAATAQRRLDSCKSCEHFTPSLKTPGFHYCAACSCGENKILEIAAGEYPVLPCPLGNPGFSNEGNPWPKYRVKQ